MARSPFTAASQQSSGGGGGNKSPFTAANQQLQQWTPKESYVKEAQSWFTGQNKQGTRNGWNTEFVDQYVSSWDHALNNGTARSFFDVTKNPNVTGVATWDHTTSDGTEVKFGDIYENGKHKEGDNVYDKYDRDEANLMMAPWILTKEQQERAYEKAVDGGMDKPDLSDLDKQISQLRQRNNVELPKAFKAAEFQKKVKDRQDDIQGGFGDELLAGGGGAVGGAGVGWGVGAVIGGAIGALGGGVGAVPGAAAGGQIGAWTGGLLGGVGGLLNKDEISEKAARSFEISKESFSENNPIAAIGTTVSQAGAVAGSLIQPTGNLAKGFTDLVKGDVGDGVTERYRQNKKGESTAPTWAKVLDVGATVADGVAQFISPIGRAAYFTTMGAQVGGEATEFGATAGASFDPRRGGFDNTFRDDQGHFDLVSGLAGTGKLAIDAVQLAGWHGLASGFARQGERAAAGERQIEMSGHRFVMNEAGQLEKKWTIGLLAPSEQVAWASTKHAARLAARKEGRATTVDDLYRAAHNLANGTNRLKASMVNAVGEAYEEGAQAILEPVSHDGKLSASEISTAMLYGAAGGLGMSMGAGAAGPTRDQRLMSDAYAIASVRAGGEVDWEQFQKDWAKKSGQEKRVAATRNESDVVMAQAALKQMSRDRVETMMGNELDAAKAETAKRTAVMKELMNQNPKSDMFTVMSGQLSAGLVSRFGTALGDTSHAEAVDMSATTVHLALDQRLKALGFQVQEMQREEARLTAEDPAHPDLAAATEQVQFLGLSQTLGRLIIEDVRRLTEAIYADTTTEAEARTYNRQLNGLLQGYYEQTLPISEKAAPGTGEQDRRDAASYFVSLLQAREPKLDAGSWLIALPQSSWELTRSKTHNLVQVNTDILQAINGDFDGDKLRAENMLVLPRERYRQLRAGQNLAGASESIDIGTRQFDQGYVDTLVTGLSADPSSLKDAADATMDNIYDAIENRYGTLMSPDALERVWKDFTTAVAARSEDARTTLLNSLAREAGENITNLGKARLRNEWLWASKVVRANFEAFQRASRAIRYSADPGVTSTGTVEDFDTPEGKTVRKQRASEDAQTLSLYAVGNTLFRKFQKIHYTWYNAPTVNAERAEKNDLEPAGSFYEELAKFVTASEIDSVGVDDSVAARVIVMLSRVVDSALKDDEFKDLTPGSALTLIANLRTKDVWRGGDGQWVSDGADMSVLQVLLKRALDADLEERSRTFERDEAAKAMHARYRRLVIPNSVRDEVNAQQAFVEVFKGVQFQDSLAGLTGHLSPMTTPEQWLRRYRSLDQLGRQAEERLLHQAPEYLDRAEKDRHDPPYTLLQYKRREVTPYLSMVDAMIAAGRAELTFDADKVERGEAKDAFGGRQADIMHQAVDNFVQSHKVIREAMLDFRKTMNHQHADRMTGAEVAQAMFRSSPQRGREFLELFPDAMANAIFTTDSATGITEVAPWVYGLFEIEDSEKAAFVYWSKLTLQSYFSKLETLKEVEPKNAYNKLGSRFERLLYRLAQEPGQMHLEAVIRRMGMTGEGIDGTDAMSNIYEFFGWLNTQPGIRQPGFEAVFLAFNDDVSDFESENTGGWTSARSGQKLREALATLRRGTEDLARTMKFRETKYNADKVYLDSIVRAHTNAPDATDGDRANLLKLEQRLLNSQELPRGFAPTAMLALTRGALDAFAEGSHDKGRTPAPFEAHGEFQAIMDAFGFMPGTERIMEVVDAHSLDSLRTNLSDLVRTSGTAMTATGQQVEWEPLDIDTAIEMLSDSRTAPLALSMLTPSAVDLTPTGTTERLLMEPSLADLLDDKYFKDLYSDHPLHGKLDQALRGLSLVESRARHEGGNFPIIRFVNSLAVAWSSALGRPATPADNDRLAEQAYIYAWELVKMVGKVESTKELRDAELLRHVREASLLVLNERRTSAALPGFVDPDTGEVAESWIDLMLADLKDEHDSRQEELDASGLPAETRISRSNLMRAEFEENEQRIMSLLDPSMAKASMTRFYLVGDDTAGADNVDRGQREHITEYVMAMANFQSRAPEAALAWAHLVDEMAAGNDYLDTISAEEWDLLSRASMGIHLFDQLIPMSSHISVPPFPKGDPAASSDRFFKYFDPSYSWVVTDILDSAPITAAASWLHMTAEQPRESLQLDQLMRTMRTTVLRENSFGPLTPGLKDQLVANEERMDSDSAPPGIAAAGNGQKRQAGVAAATRRTGKVPDADRLTTMDFPANWLEGDEWWRAEKQVTLAGTTQPISMKLGVLENRFFKSISIDGFAIPLDEGNLGFAWDGAEEENEYRYVSMARLLPILQRYSQGSGIPMKNLTITVEFFHPDSQPPVGWYNNAFYEGMSHTLLPDGSESVIATLWSDNDGKITEDTQWTIDAGKKGLRAIQPFRRPREEVLDEADKLWTQGHDFAAMLRRKTEIVMEYDDGSGPLRPAYFNAQYKHRKLSHIVVGLDEDGNVAGMTAEQVIAFQRENGIYTIDANGDTVPVPLPLQNAKLVVLSPDMVRTMLGDTGDQSIGAFLDEDFLVNQDAVPRYEGITEEMLHRFGAGWLSKPISLGQTTLAHVGAQRVQTVRTMRTDADRNAREERIKYRDKQDDETRTARQKKLPEGHARKGLNAVIDVARDLVGGDRNPFNLSHLTGGMMLPRDMQKSKYTQVLLDGIKNIVDLNEYSRGWTVNDGTAPDTPNGVLNVESLSGDPAVEDRIVKSDLTVVGLDSFVRENRDPDMQEQRLEKALELLSQTGTTILLGPGPAASELRAHGASLMEALGYAPVAGSAYIFQPVEYTYITQNERAYRSTEVETRRFKPNRNAITLLAIDPIFELDENDAIQNSDSSKLKDRKRVRNLVPSSWSGHFNVPLEDNRNDGVYARARQQLLYMLDPTNLAARNVLLEMGGKDPASLKPLNTALDTYFKRISDRGTLTPEVGDDIEVGDIIPFVNNRGQVVLYRHGFDLPHYDELNELFSRNDGMNIAVGKSKTEPGQTKNSGKINRFEPRVGYGYEMVLEIPLQPFGDKVQLEWNGMKYVTVPEPEGFKPPVVFSNGTVVDLVADLKSALSKEAHEGRTNHYRNALSFYQWDFTDDLVEFFFPDPSTRGAEARIVAINLLNRLANATEYKIPMDKARALSLANVSVADMLGSFAQRQYESLKIDPEWLDTMVDETTASAQIGRALVMYALTNGADIDSVIKSSGFSHPRALTDAVEVRAVPGIFADLLDYGFDSPLHKELTKRFGDQFHRGPNGEGLRLKSNWQVEVFGSGIPPWSAYLQFGEAHSAGDNPVTNAQAYDETDKSDVSLHNALAAGLSIGAHTVTTKGLKESKKFARSFTREGKSLTTSKDVWDALVTLPNVEGAQSAAYRQETPAATIRRAEARKEITGLFKGIDDDAWEDPLQAIEYNKIATRVLDRLNLYGSQRAMFDTWVRQALGRPYQMMEDGTERGVINGRDAVETAREIWENVKNNDLPVKAGRIPLIDVNMLTTIYMANVHRDGQTNWAPRTGEHSSAPLAGSWKQWVEIALGTAFDEDRNPRFEHVYLLATDGMMHGYQGATTSTRDLPVTSNELILAKLFDEDTNTLLVSISEDENLLANDPVMWNSSRAELEDILGGQRIYANTRNGPDPSSAQGMQDARLKWWRRETNIPEPTRDTVRGVRTAGNAWISHSTKTNQWYRMAFNLRVGNTMINIPLIASAPIEAFYRRNQDAIFKALTLEGTGVIGRGQVKLLEAIKDHNIGAVAQLLGVEPNYTSDQLKRMNLMIRGLASNPDFKAMIYKELMFQYPSMPGISKIEKWLEQYAKYGARIQDPSWGMLPRDLARLYVDKAMANTVLNTTGENVYSIDRLIAELPRNPEWLKQQDLDVHNMAIASIANMRSTKPTVLSLAMRGWINPLSENPKFLPNTAGNFLKIMVAFQSFWANYGVQMAGLQAVDHFAAAWLDGRTKSKLMRRFQAGLKGETFDPEQEEVYDMSEVLESMDLADAFIRGGISHTALFAFGALAGGLGLGGEDDEQKFRRRQAELQGVPVLYDPRDIANDFRNKDAIFLDWLPFGMDSWFKVNPDDPNSRSMAQMNWVMRTFLSPILGMERFYETGDFQEVIHGFKDAMGSHPILNEQLWDVTMETVADLHDGANAAAEQGDGHQAVGMLTSAVTVMERMLFENGMVNVIYQGIDDYDRDPYVVPLTDSDGNLQKDFEGNARPQNLALNTFYEDGKLKQGYASRRESNVFLHQLSENRFTIAFISSLFDGGLGQSDFWRYNMPIKQREIEMTKYSQDEAEAFVKAQYGYSHGRLANVTPEELLQKARDLLYAQARATGEYNNNVDAEAWALAKRWSSDKGRLRTSLMKSSGGEELTDEGARGIFQGLRSGALTFGDLDKSRGVAIPYDMRERILADWTKELVQEGIDLGLDKSTAVKRMKRITQGPLDDPTKSGLADLLFDTKRIPLESKVRYAQLNTTYVMGPDGRPWATGFERDGLLGALSLKPFKHVLQPEHGGTRLDMRANTVDLVHGINTGLRALEPLDASRNIPTDVEIGKSIEKAIKDAAKGDYEKFKPWDKKKSGGSGWKDFGNGWRNFGHGWQNYGRRRGGGGGYGGGGGGGYFVKMDRLPEAVSVYANQLQFINTSNPILRRAFIRRERVQSERGRLKQWQ